MQNILGYYLLDYDGLQEYDKVIQANYVKQEKGKALSTNDFTDVYKSKLDNIDLESKKVSAGVMFDGVSSVGTRLGGASNLVWEKSSDVYAGRDDFPSTYNCYNTYEVLVKNGKVVAVEGTYEFESHKDDDEYDADVFVAFPKWYGQRFYDGDGNEYRYISDVKLSGYAPSPMHYLEGVEYDTVYISKYMLSCDSKGNICSRSNKPKMTAHPWSWYEQQCQKRGYHAGTIYEYTALQHMALIKYANYNVQNTVGMGNSSGYLAREKCCTVAQTNSNSVIVATSNLSDLKIGDSICITTINDSQGRFCKITNIESYDDTNTKITFSCNPFNSTVGGINFYRIGLWSGECDKVLGLDGELSTGTSGRKSVLTLGIEDLYANTWKLLGGGFRQGKDFYINPYPITNPYISTTLDNAIAQGYTKIQSNLPNEGYIKTFGYNKLNQFLTLTASVGGNSTNPVGDYFYINSDTNLKLPILGGSLSYGAGGGLFFWYLNHGLSLSNVRYGSFGVLREKG